MLLCTAIVDKPVTVTLVTAYYFPLEVPNIMFIFDYTNTNKFESRKEQFLDSLLETDI